MSKKPNQDLNKILNKPSDSPRFDDLSAFEDIPAAGTSGHNRGPESADENVTESVAEGGNVAGDEAGKSDDDDGEKNWLILDPALKKQVKINELDDPYRPILTKNVENEDDNETKKNDDDDDTDKGTK